MSFSLKTVRKQLYIAGCLYIGEIVFGYCLSWPSKVIQKLLDPEATPLPYIINVSDIPWLGSIATLGAFIGIILLWFIENKISRKSCLYMGAMIVIITFAVFLFTNSILAILIARFVNGIGTCVIFVVNLVYLGEIASKEIRGFLLASTVMFNVLGLLLGFIIIPYVSYAAAQYICILLTLVYLIGIVLMPESPMYELSKGDKSKVKKIMESLGRVDDFPDLVKRKELLNNRAKISELFNENTNRKALTISSVLYLSQHLSGTVCINSFATIIFEMADSSIHPDTATIIMGVTQLVSCVIGSFTIEKFGRKILLFISSFFVSLAQFGLGTYFYLYSLDKAMVDSMRWLPLTFLIIVFIFYNMGFGQIPGTLMGEMFTQNMRSTGSAISLIPAMLLGFLTSLVFGYIIQAVGNYIPFWFFSGTCVFTFLFTAIYVPETKGKSLLEVQQLLNK